MKKKFLSLLLVVAVGLGACAFDGNGLVEESDGATVTQQTQSLESPSIALSKSGYQGLKLSWQKVSGADGYKVYRATSKSGTYKRIKTTTSLSYTDKAINQNQTYYYKVTAVKDSQTSGYSNVKSGKINTVVSLSKIPDYSGEAYVEVNNNVPRFSARMYTRKSSEHYSKLDSLGRCGIAWANIGQDLMPTEERGSIGMIKPTGWHTIKYDIVDGKYLYNRCHLIGYQLTGENANERNLITGTRYMNVTGMLPFENMVADYIKETGNHVLYRVVPIFDGKNLVAKGVQMEAVSVEDKGEGISFNVFVYNVQPGIVINYKNGESYQKSNGQTGTESGSSSSGSSGNNGNSSSSGSSSGTTKSKTYVLNTSTKKFHLSTCSSVGRMSEKNKKTTKDSRSSIIAAGYSPCKICNP